MNTSEVEIKKNDISGIETHEGEGSGAPKKTDEHAHCEGEEKSGTHDALVQTEVILGSSEYTNPTKAKVGSIALPSTIVKEDWNGPENGQSHEDLANEENNNVDKTRHNNILKPREVTDISVDEKHEENEEQVDEHSDDEKEADEMSESPRTSNIEHEQTYRYQNDSEDKEKENEESGGYQETGYKEIKDHGDFKNVSKFDEKEQEIEQREDNKELQDTKPIHPYFENGAGVALHEEDAVTLIQNKDYEDELQSTNKTETEIQENMSQEVRQEQCEAELENYELSSQQEQKVLRGEQIESEDTDQVSNEAEGYDTIVEEPQLVLEDEDFDKEMTPYNTEEKSDRTEEEVERNVQDTKEIRDEKNEEQGFDEEVNEEEEEESTLENADSEDGPFKEHLSENVYSEENQNKPTIVDETEADRIVGDVEEKNIEDTELVGDDEKEMHKDKQNKAEEFEYPDLPIDLGKDRDDLETIEQDNYRLSLEDNEMDRSDGSEEEIEFEGDDETLAMDDVFEDNVETQPEDVGNKVKEEQDYEIKSDEENEKLEVSLENRDSERTEEELVADPLLQETETEQEIKDQKEEGIFHETDNVVDEDNHFGHERGSTPDNSLPVNLDLRSEPFDVSRDLKAKDSPDNAFDKEMADAVSVHVKDKKDTVTEITEKIPSEQASEDGESSSEHVDEDQTDKTELDEFSNDSTTNSSEKHVPTLRVTIENKDEEVNSAEEDSSLVPEACLEVVMETDIKPSASLHVKDVKELFETRTHLNEDERDGERNEYEEAPVSPGLVSNLRKFFENPKNFEYIKP